MGVWKNVSVGYIGEMVRSPIRIQGKCGAITILLFKNIKYLIVSTVLEHVNLFADRGRMELISLL